MKDDDFWGWMLGGAVVLGAGAAAAYALTRVDELDEWADPRRLNAMSDAPSYEDVKSAVYTELARGIPVDVRFLHTNGGVEYGLPEARYARVPAVGEYVSVRDGRKGTVSEVHHFGDGYSAVWAKLWSEYDT